MHANVAERFECPAQAEARICANCQVSHSLPPGTSKVDGPPELAIAPKACRQGTIGTPGDVMPKIRQCPYCGSHARTASYTRRSRVEGAFGAPKISKTENMRRGWAHVAGLVKTCLMVASAQAVANLRYLRTLVAITGG